MRLNSPYANNGTYQSLSGSCNIAPRLPGEFVVDSAQHDTTSILATIEHRFGLAPLGTRDAAVKDLSTVFRAREGGDGGQDGGGGDNKPTTNS